jgi:hypothetical protein
VRGTWEGQSVGVTTEMLVLFAVAAASCAAATFIPLKLALRKMESFEF